MKHKTDDYFLHKRYDYQDLLVYKYSKSRENYEEALWLVSSDKSFERYLFKFLYELIKSCYTGRFCFRKSAEKLIEDYIEWKAKRSDFSEEYNFLARNVNHYKFNLHDRLVLPAMMLIQPNVSFEGWSGYVMLINQMVFEEQEKNKVFKSIMEYRKHCLKLLKSLPKPQFQ